MIVTPPPPVPMLAKGAIVLNGRLFLTLTAAKTAAVSGDTIFVGPGTYNERDLLKNGVNWWFAPGAIVNYSVVAGDSDWTIFDDNNTAITSRIGGFGDFIVTNTAAQDDAPPKIVNVVRTENAGSNLAIQARRIQVDCPTSGDNSVVGFLKGTIAMDVVEFIGSGPFGPKGLYIENADVFCRIQRAIIQTGYAFRCYDTQRTTPKVILEANYLEAQAAVLGQESSAATNGVSETTGYGMVARIGHLNCIGLSNFSGAVHCGGGTMEIHCNRISAGPGSTQCVLVDLGELHLEAVHLVGVASPELVKTTGGTLNHTAFRYGKNSNGLGVNHTAGVTIIDRAHIDVSPTTGKHASQATGAGLKLRACTLLTAGVGKSIENTGPVSVLCYPPCVGNVAAGAPAGISGTLTIDAALG
jgi:hypothetical protein